MPLYTVHDGVISMQHSHNVPRRLLPDEDITVVAPCCYVFSPLADKVCFLDVCVCIRVTGEAVRVVVGLIFYRVLPL